MGNMLSLSRYGDISAGTKGPVDNLTITYDGDGAASASVTDYRATSYVQEKSADTEKIVVQPGGRPRMCMRKIRTKRRRKKVKLFFEDS